MLIHDEMINKLDRKQADVLEALLWWLNGFQDARQTNGAPNTTALCHLPEIIRDIVETRENSRGEESNDG